MMLAIPALANAAQLQVEVRHETGTSPFTTPVPDPKPVPPPAGDDYGPDDAFVRSNDFVKYIIEFSANAGDADDVVITHELPAGMEWDRLPATCAVPPSGISPDKRTLTCAVGDVKSATAKQLEISAKVTELTNGTTLTPPTDAVSVSAANAPTVAATPDPVTVSSRPHVDLIKSTPTVTPQTVSGTDGYLISYPISVVIPNMGSRGQIGMEPPSDTYVFEDNFVDVPGATFHSLQGNTGATWTTTATQGDPSPAQITVVRDTAPSTVNPQTLASATITVFLPRSVIDAAPGGQITTVNRLENLVTAGQPSEANLANNQVSLALSTSGGSGLSVSKRYVDLTQTPSWYIPGGPNVSRGGYTPVYAGQRQHRVDGLELQRGHSHRRQSR